MSNDDTTSLPLAVLIDVGNFPDAGMMMQALLHRAYPYDAQPLELSYNTSAHGNSMYIAPAGHGYALIRNWLVISPAIVRGS